MESTRAEPEAIDNETFPSATLRNIRISYLSVPKYTDRYFQLYEIILVISALVFINLINIQSSLQDTQHFMYFVSLLRHLH